MKKLFFKTTIYFVLILICLEVTVRVFHLHNELPIEYVAEDGIAKWVPYQKGYSVYGNRRQVFEAYKINSSGYNSYREFKPSKDKFEIALLGDSYIEGFHQNFNNSIGKKIERTLEKVNVLEYGHSANDFADQLNLIYKNPQVFDLIDHIFIRIKYEKGLKRGEYKFIKRKPFFGPLRRSKLVVYLLNIGMTDPIKEIHRNILSIKNNGIFNKKNSQNKKKQDDIELNIQYLNNFKSLISYYNFNKEKTTLMIDTNMASNEFVDYLKEQNIKFIDYSIPLDKANKPTDLIFDKHWNNYGRTIIANCIVDYLIDNEIINK